MSSPVLEAIRPRSIAYSPGSPQRHEGVVLLEVGEVEAGHPAGQLERRLAGPLELGHERCELRLRRCAVHAADPEVDRVDLAPADHVHHLVAGLLQPQRRLDEVAPVTSQLDRAVVAEEVRRVEHRHVQDVALDPLAAVDEAAEEPRLLGELDPADGLHRVARARDVGDRADAADARRDVGRLGELPAAQERLEEARRLEDLELDVLDLVAAHSHEQGALALDARQVVGADLARVRLVTHAAAPGTGEAGASALGASVKPTAHASGSPPGTRARSR